MTLLHTFNDGTILKAQSFPEVKPGMTIKVHQKITEETEKGPRERTQIYEGVVIAKHGTLPSQCTITVRKISNGIGVERIFPLASPTIEKIEITRIAKVRRAKLYYLRKLTGKATKLKEFFVSETELKALEEKQQEAKDIRAAKEKHAVDSQLSATQASQPAASNEKTQSTEAAVEDSPKSS